MKCSCFIVNKLLRTQLIVSYGLKILEKDEPYSYWRIRINNSEMNIGVFIANVCWNFITKDDTILKKTNALMLRCIGLYFLYCSIVFNFQNKTDT